MLSSSKQSLASAFLSHSAVSARIKDASFARHLAHKPIIHLHSLGHCLWTADDEIDGIISTMDPIGDLRGRTGRVLVRSDDYREVDIRIGPGIAARVGTEKEDFSRVEFTDDFVRESLNITE